MQSRWAWRDLCGWKSSGQQWWRRSEDGRTWRKVRLHRRKQEERDLTCSTARFPACLSQSRNVCKPIQTPILLPKRTSLNRSSCAIWSQPLRRTNKNHQYRNPRLFYIESLLRGTSHMQYDMAMLSLASMLSPSHTQSGGSKKLHWKRPSKWSQCSWSFDIESWWSTRDQVASSAGSSWWSRSRKWIASWKEDFAPSLYVQASAASPSRTRHSLRRRNHTKSWSRSDRVWSSPLGSCLYVCGTRFPPVPLCTSVGGITLSKKSPVLVPSKETELSMSKSQTQDQTER